MADENDPSDRLPDEPANVYDYHADTDGDDVTAGEDVEVSCRLGSDSWYEYPAGPAGGGACQEKGAKKRG